MILVLPADASSEHLAEITAECERLGWTHQTSRGTEQTVVTLGGEGNELALLSFLDTRPGIDVVPMLTRKQYQWMQSRRRLLATLAGSFGALTVAGAALPVAGFLLPPKGALPDRNFVRVASADEMEPRTAKRVKLLGERVLLVRMAEDRFFALSAICTHMNICLLDWNEERGQLVCPCHGGAFDVYGNVVQGPPSIPLPTFEVDRLGNDVYLRKEV